jgi:hypothetical protein
VQAEAAPATEAPATDGTGGTSARAVPTPG